MGPLEFNLLQTLLWLALLLVLGGVFGVQYSLDKQERFRRTSIYYISSFAVVLGVLLFGYFGYVYICSAHG